MTGQDLGYKPEVHEYSPLGRSFNEKLKKMIELIVSIDTTMIWCIILCITLINIVCLILMKYHQLYTNFKKNL